MLRRFDLFEQKSVAFQPRDAQGNPLGEQQKIADYWAISEERINALTDAQYLELKNNGAIGAVYAHLISLLNWSRVIQRAIRAQQQGGARLRRPVQASQSLRKGRLFAGRPFFCHLDDGPLTIWRAPSRSAKPGAYRLP